MTDANEHKAEKAKSQPEINAPSSRVTIAFPFSTIKVQEPDENMREFAAIVRDLAKQLAELRPGPDADDLVRRARAMIVKFGS
jgi:DNA topoisomerase VI subunit B